MPLQSIKEIYTRISHAAMRSGRCPSEVRLVAVSKTVDAATISEAVEAGMRDFGENRVQEAREKIPRVRASSPRARIRWHLLGHLQKNKAAVAVELFSLIHSLDSPELAAVLNRHAELAGKRQKCLVQVKLSHEDSKTGLPEEQLFPLMKEASRMPNLELQGLMTIPPFFDDPEAARPYFRRLRELRDECLARGYTIKELSMGMSGDFEVAIEEGATIVRVGTSIFGERRMVQ